MALAYTYSNLILILVLWKSWAEAATSSIPLTRHRRSNLDANDPANLPLAGIALRNKYGVASSKYKRMTGDNQLINLSQDTSYIGSIAIGTPARSFNVILDTGSADLWLASPDCYSGCNGVPSFQAASSSTFRNLSTPFAIKYGTGSAQGTLATDNVQMAGFGVASQTFAMVNVVMSNLLRSPVSGLLGLAWATLASSKSEPFWESLAETDAWNEPVMAIHLTRFRGVLGAQSLEVGGSFDFGFTNSSLYTGNIEYVPIPNGAASFWQIPLTDITVEGQPITLTGQVLAAIDTGTTLIGGPASAIAAIYSQVPNAVPASGDYQGYWQYPCLDSINISLTFGSGPSWPIDPSDFVLARLQGGMCVGGLFELNTSGTNSPTWIIGDTFLKNVYTVFRYNPPSVGFAALSQAAIAESNVDAPLPSPSIGTGNVISSALSFGPCLQVALGISGVLAGIMMR